MSFKSKTGLQPEVSEGRQYGLIWRGLRRQGKESISMSRSNERRQEPLSRMKKEWKTRLAISKRRHLLHLINILASRFLYPGTTCSVSTTYPHMQILQVGIRQRSVLFVIPRSYHSVSSTMALNRAPTVEENNKLSDVSVYKIRLKQGARGMDFIHSTLRLREG